MSNVVRLYHIAVSLILQHGRVAIELLSKELDLFTAKDTTYTPAKIDELKLLLKNANQLPDETVLDEQGGLTQAFQDFMTNGKEHYEELSYFIRKKFNFESPFVCLKYRDHFFSFFFSCCFVFRFFFFFWGCFGVEA